MFLVHIEPTTQKAYTVHKICASSLNVHMAAHRVYDEVMSLGNVPGEIQNESLMRAILLELTLYTL